jgi:hypothetical protein
LPGPACEQLVSAIRSGRPSRYRRLAGPAPRTTTATAFDRDPSRRGRGGRRGTGAGAAGALEVVGWARTRR